MPKKRLRVTRSTEVLAQSIAAQLQRLPLELPADKTELRQRVQHLTELYSEVRELGVSHVNTFLTANNASERILDYLRLYVGEELEGAELEVVSGISEYARRVREWRVEFGWPIAHHGSLYRLERESPDAEKAGLWQLLNTIRRSEKSARDKMLDVFRSLPVGTPVTTAQLRYVTEGKDMRRVRELRTEYGWRIMTQKTGMPQLKIDQYVLADDEPMAEHDRRIDFETVIAVLKRDQNRCRKCGWHPNERVPGDPRQYIELHHVLFHAQGGPNDEENLVTLCNAHHKQAHRLELPPEAFEKWLKATA